MSALLLSHSAILAPALGAAQGPAQDPGAPRGDLFGFALEGIGDLDGDGVPDLLIGDATAWMELELRPYVWAFSLGRSRTLFAVGDGEGTLAWAPELVATDDLDGDGRPDFAALMVFERGLDRCLELALRSGADGSGIARRTLVDREDMSVNQLALYRLPDLDADGVRDLAVAGNWSCGHDAWPGDPQDFGSRRSRVWVLSGADLSILLELAPAAGEPSFLDALAPLGDLDGDGRAELAICFGDPRSYTGRVRALSSADGRVLWNWGEEREPLLWPKLSAAGDLDGDGVADLFVLDARSRTRKEEPTISLVSGASGRIEFVEPSGRRTRYGPDLEPLEDLDGDGEAELLLFDHNALSPGYGLVLSGGALEPLLSVTGGGYLPTEDDVHFGFSATGLGDVDGDGTADFAIGAASPWSAADSRGSVQVFSGRDGALLRRIVRADVVE